MGLCAAPRRVLWEYNIGMERYRIVADVGVYYVTFTVVEWLPVFIDETALEQTHHNLIPSIDLW